MMRIWGKIIRDNHLLRDTVVVLEGPQRRTLKIFEGLRLICMEFDLAVPTWLDVNVKEFQRIAKTRFRQDSFIEQIPFDYLEIQVIEDDIP
ncbi:MAG: hypothetical protein IJK77_09610 [Lachnospiraceae bacterium]|nr:hypothetical protein [Lachnospiraceae bacterium]